MKRPKAQQKLLNDFYSLRQAELFNNAILRLRKKFNLPPNGLPKPEHDLIFHKGQTFIPEQLLDENGMELRDDVKILAKKYSPFVTNVESWEEVVLGIVIYGMIEPQHIEFVASDVIEIIDIKATLKKDYFSDDHVLSDLRNTVEDKPIAILISPFMGRNDIVDAIEATYRSYIKPIQQRYKSGHVKIGKKRSKNVKLIERDALIWKYHLEGKSAKKIAMILKDDHGISINYAYVNTIIRNLKSLSTSTKKRK